MKNLQIILLSLLLFSIASCIPPMRSVTGIEPGQDAYKTIAVVSNIDPSIEKPCLWFHDAISTKIASRDIEVYKHTITAQPKTLALNVESKSDELVAMLRDQKPELIISIKPTYKLYEDRALSRVDYEAVGIDTEKDMEVWKATFSLYRQLFSGAHKSAETVAEKLFVQMIKDRVI